VKNSKLSFGLRTGIYSQTINANYLRAVDHEAFLDGGSQSQIKPDMAVVYFGEKKSFMWEQVLIT